MSNGLKGLVVLAAVLLPGRMYAMEASSTPAVPVPCDAAALDGGCAEKAVYFVAAGFAAGKATATFAGLMAACADGVLPACFMATGAGAAAVKAGLETVRAGKALAECDDEE
ncbi:MAG: hypothetical protein WCK74_00235 [Gemmatimonadaceae bacterium]